MSHATCTSRDVVTISIELGTGKLSTASEVTFMKSNYLKPNILKTNQQQMQTKTDTQFYLYGRFDSLKGVWHCQKRHLVVKGEVIIVWRVRSAKGVGQGL